MTKKIFILLLLLCSTAFGQWQDGQKPMLGRQIDYLKSNGLVGYWLMNEGTGNIVNDLSGNGNTATISSGIVWELGKFGPALYNDAGGHYVNCGDMASIEGVGAFSVSFWAMHKTGVVPGTQFLVAKYGDSGERTFGFYATDAEYILFGVYNSSAAFDYALSLNALKTAGKWIHVVGVYDGVNVRVYVDGILGGTVGDLTGVTDSSTEPMVLMAENDNGQNDFGGMIDDVSVYNRALSVAEIAELYANPFGMFEPTFPVWWYGGIGAEEPAGTGQVIFIGGY